MNSIGGFFELELNSDTEYYPQAIALNSARNAFEYILKVRLYKKIYIPYFSCDVLFEPITKLKVEYEFYHIDENLEPIFDFNKINSNEGFLYTNYFGLKEFFIKDLASKISNLIVDNAQAFFSDPIRNVDTFYSPRKFFGVSDGAYLFCNQRLNEELVKDISFHRMSHLMIRADISAEDGYAEFCNNDKSLINQPIKKMSNLTRKILGSIDYQKIKLKRIHNFDYLHKFLKDRNLLKFGILNSQGPMVYPFWSKDTSLRNRLINHKIYCATYWPNVKEWCGKESLEYQLASEVVYLPMDQRYGEIEMNQILKIIKE